MPRKVKITTDHDEIRRWVEARGGWPATVQRAGAPRSPGELRIGFPDSSRDKKIKQISWGEFFQKLGEGRLALELEERDEEGGLSEFHRIISRQDAMNVREEALRRPTRAGRRLQRLAVRAGKTEGPLSEEKSRRRKKVVRQTKIRKAA